MTILSKADLAARARVDPWALQAKIAVGDPAQVESLAAAFYKAGGNMSQARTDQQRSAQYRGQGYTTAGTSPIDFDKEAQSTIAAPENLQQIGKILDGVAADLSGAMKTANDEVHTLDGELQAIETRWSQFMQQIGHHLPPDDQAATRDGLIQEAVGKVKSHGSTIDGAIKKYEETIFGAQKSMSDLGYVPPAALDDLYGDGAEYVRQLQQKAREEADKLKNNHELDGNWGKLAHQVAGDVAPFMNDPYFASAFYGELGPQLTESLPSFLRETGSDTAAGDIKTFGHMFGTAVTNMQDDGNMPKVADVFLHDPGNAATSWNRGVMCSNGDFPPDWLAKAARANALDEFAEHGDQGFGGMGFDGAPAGPFAGQLGLSTDDVGLWAGDLGRNPVAAREALATMGNGDLDNVHITGDPSAAYNTNIHKLIEYGHDIGGVAHDNAGVQRGYGALFEAASGADDEHDGAHSDAAITFAKALFNDVGHDADHVGPVAAENFAKIGGSYVQEMAAGHELEGTGVLGVPEDGHILGDNAAFGIPPELAKDFMKTFVGNEEATQIFDNAAGQAAHHAMLAGAQQDVALLHDGKSAYRLADAASAYGSVAGSENGAAIQVVGKEVEDQEHAQESMRKLLSWGVDLIPGGKISESLAGSLVEHGGQLAGNVAKLLEHSDSAWDVGKHVSNMGLENIYGAEPGSQEELDHLKDASYQAAMVGDYQRTALLHEAGYPGTDAIPKDLVASNGQMLDVATVMKNDGLRQQYYEYMHTAAHDPQGTLGPGASVYEVTKNAAGRYTDSYLQARGNDDGE